MQNSNSITAGPPTAETEGLHDISHIAQMAGLRGGLFVEPALYSRVMPNTGDNASRAIDLTKNFRAGLDRLLVSERADYRVFDFKHWYRRSSRSRKDTSIKVRAELYQTTEGYPWVKLSISPKNG